MQSHLFKSNPISWTLIGSGGSCYTLGLPSCHGDVRVRVCVVDTSSPGGGWVVAWVGEDTGFKDLLSNLRLQSCVLQNEGRGRKQDDRGREGRDVQRANGLPVTQPAHNTVQNVSGTHWDSFQAY